MEVEETGTSQIAKRPPEFKGYSLKVVNMVKHSPKSSTYDDDLMAQMTSRFNSLVYVMGFEDPVEDDTMQVLMLWIQEQFGDLSINEMIYAFQLATAHNLPGVTRHYKNFDMQYCGDVLNAYKTYRNQQLKIFKEEEKVRQIMEDQGKGATGEEMYKVMKKIAMERGELMKIAQWSTAYEYAIQEGIIDEKSEEERKKYAASVEKDMERLAKQFRTQKVGKIINTPREIGAECRKRILHEHLQKIIDENKDQ